LLWPVPSCNSSLISRRKNFAQLEDFNVEKDEAAKKYNEEYMAKMANKPKGAAAPPSAKPPSEADKASATNAPQVMGCYGREVQFGKDRVYQGDDAGANIKKTMMLALSKNKNYFAMARDGPAGHAFIFDTLTTGDEFDLEECATPCEDVDQYYCGCSDGTCGELSKAKGEEHLRRWIVYKITDESKEWYAQKKKEAAKAEREKAKQERAAKKAAEKEGDKEDL